MTASISDVSGQTFDYVVIGEKTSGLTVAARLSEDPNVTVAVLEAGSANLDDPLIDVPAQFGKQFGNPKYSWEYSTLPQKTANDKVYKWPRGKTLGGSSAINYFMWTKPPTVDIDAWEKLGNSGWSAARFFEYSRKVEKFHPPTDEAVAKANLQVFRPEAHGYDGPLDISFPAASAMEIPFQKALANAGVKVAKDPLNGDPFGVTMVPNSHHPVKRTRTSAATAFYLPNKDRENFKVLPDAHVNRIVIKSSGNNSDVEAEGVEFEHQGQIHIVKASKEVIISAGTLQTPQVLELSGIGDKRILEPFGIKTLVDLPGVGANMQEHSFVSLISELEPSLTNKSLDILRTDPDYAKEQLALFGKGESLFHIGLSSTAFEPLKTMAGEASAQEMIQRQKARVQTQIESGLLSKSLQEQYKLQLEKLENNQSGDCELILIPFGAVPSVVQKGRSCVSITSALNLPFSRGTIHIKSTNPRDQPIVDPHTFEDTFDLDVMTATFKFVRKLSDVEPWKSIITKEVFPGPSVQSDEDIHNYLKEGLVTTYHTAGTASMLPRELDGVVDPKLRVYGTKNIRVVDLSIVPLHIASHTQATAYTIAEIAADMIKGVI
ncbi:GMC oxidoreductase [Schizopora paradoxa]|uniref:GMC oxidoreductase n=1 Tax=Schizopora paradoxa TaxID=27342 RepID=A0A0H2RJK7_9AGAM|nr:GMC oxidoreductase [Schizopora paradoxa]